MKDPKFQAIWHDLNEAQIALIHASSEKDRSKRAALLTDAQSRAKNADERIKELLASRFPTQS